MNNKFFKTYKSALCATAIGFLLPVAMQSVVHASDSKNKWRAKLDLAAKAGNKRHIGRIGAFAPLMQSDSSMLFLDLRFMADSRRNQEGNFGLGYRMLDESSNAIWGMYAFYDRRLTKFGSKINQATFGVERLSDTWDARLNVYIPQKKTKTKTTGEVVKVHRTGYDAVTTQKAQKEVPLRGLDVEIGRSNPGVYVLRVFGGGY
jgi:hypothetical protein